MSKRILVIVCVAMALTSCKGVKYCENQTHDFLNEDFKPCTADKASYKQKMVIAQGVPMNSRGKLITGADCDAAAHQNANAELLDGIKDDFKEGVRRIYSAGKLMYEIYPSKGEKKQLLVFNDYSQVSEAQPYYRSWYFDDYSGEVKMMRVNFLGTAQGHHEDFKDGMLKFETYPSYAGGIKRDVRIAFDHAQELQSYISAHNAKEEGWLSQMKAKLAAKTAKKNAKRDKKKARKEKRRLRKLRRLNKKVVK